MLQTVLVQKGDLHFAIHRPDTDNQALLARSHVRQSCLGDAKKPVDISVKYGFSALNTVIDNGSYERSTP